MRLFRRSPESEDKEENSSPGELLRFLLILAGLAWVLRSLIVSPFSIPSGSMLPTLYVGDYLIAAKWPYGYSRYSFPLGIPSFEGRIPSIVPERGDVVVFRHPNEDADLIKRVIGLPGDAVEVRGGRVLLNGRMLPRERIDRFEMTITPNSPCKVVPPASAFTRVRDGQPHCLYSAFRETLPGGRAYTVLDQVEQGQADDFPSVVVPEGHLFLMGDNRDDSLDSRFAASQGGVGFVPLENLIGRATVTFWSTDGSASYWKPWTWFSALRWNRIGNGYFGPPE